MANKLSQIDQMSLSVNRGMHKAILRQLANGHMDLREISEPMRQRLIDLAMLEPPLVDVDADRVSITDAGRRVINPTYCPFCGGENEQHHSMCGLAQRQG